jgi:uncharacterized membrane protein
LVGIKIPLFVPRKLLNEKTVDLLFFLKLKLIPLSETAFLRYQATNLKDAIGTYMEEA